MIARALRLAPVVAVLACGWLMLHGDWSIANALGGVLLGVALVVMFPPDASRLRHRFHPVAFVQLVLFVLYSLVLSSWAVIKVILRPTPESLRSGIVRVTLSEESQLTATLVANSVTLTPGTMTLTARLDPAELHIHVLGLADAEQFRESVHDLERRTVAAFTPRPPSSAKT
jgi:multicomponent Na+:H+ antiporter subunit E